MANRKIIFAGPSLAGTDIEDNNDLIFLPPCKQGDIFLAGLEQPCAIGIIDGFFEGAPSVWHKEILWALSQGIHVVGASSMGALRAAELDVFGMLGIGKIYEAYRDGVLTDDDEVALQHGPAEMQHIPLSIPMVNVRATCRKAIPSDIISEQACAEIEDLAKSIFYKERNWPEILDLLDGSNIDKKQQSAFKAWLDKNEVDQKKLDAQALVAFVANNAFTKPFKPTFTFEETEFWHRNTKYWKKRNARPEPKSGDEGYRLFT